MTRFIIGGLALAVAVLAACWSLNERAELREEVARVTKERDAAQLAKAEQNKQYQVENSVSQWAALLDFNATKRIERERVEIREKIISAPCAGEFVPVAAAVRLFSSAERARRANVPGVTGQPNSAAPASVAE